jgi:drug/metabolite transporter (DMT)-like permease
MAQDLSRSSYSKTGSLFSKISRIKSATTIGFIVAIASAALSALPDVLTKPFVDPAETGMAPVNPMMVVLIMYLATGLLFTPIVKMQKNKAAVKRSVWPILIIYGVASACSTLAFSFGLQDTSATNASILANSETVFTILIGMIIFKEYLTKRETLPFALIVVGAILLPIFSDVANQRFALSAFVFGDFMIILSGFIYCLCTFIAKRASSVNVARVVQWMSLSGAAFIFITMLALGNDFAIDFADLSFLSLIGIAGIGGSVMFFVLAVRLLGAVRTILIFSSTTVFGVFYSAVYLQEPTNLFNIASIAFVMFGLYHLRYKLAA